MPSASREVAVPPVSRRKPRLDSTAVAPAARRKTLQYLLVFVTLVVIINGLVGERGLVETVRARERHAELAGAIERLRAENARLRAEVRRLRTDPATIEGLARRDLGLMKPGEVLFIVKEAGASATAGLATSR